MLFRSWCIAAEGLITNSHRQMKAELFCNSADELERKISGLQAQSPNVAAKDNDERLVLYAYLRKRRSELHFPIRIVHQDRPDFILYESDDEIGLEASKLTTEPCEEGLSITRVGCSDIPLNTTKLLGTAQMEKPDILNAMIAEEAISTNLPISQFESTWRDQLVKLIKDKINKAEQYPNERIHLLISDRLSFNDSEIFFRTGKFEADINNAMTPSGKIDLVFIAGLHDGTVMKKKRRCSMLEG